MTEVPIYGVMAEFVDAKQLCDAALRARREWQFAHIEAYSPFPVDGLAEALDEPRTHIALWTLLGGIFGGGTTFFLEWYSAVVDYPINVGGRPAFSWPAFVPAALEMTILWAVLFGVAAMLIGNGLPRLHHPLFGASQFQRASDDRFFLVVRADDALFELRACFTLLESCEPISICAVPQ